MNSNSLSILLPPSRSIPSLLSTVKNLTNGKDFTYISGISFAVASILAKTKFRLSDN